MRTHTVVVLLNLLLFRSVVVGKTPSILAVGTQFEAEVAHLEFGIEIRLAFCPVVVYGTVLGTITSLFGFYDLARENGSKLVLQKFP